ncbi:MAG: hypothetical protein ABIO60_06470, partial [Aquaticitalea sp.]
MKKIYLLLAALTFTLISFGQTTIAQQDFETTPATPVLGYSSTVTPASAGGVTAGVGVGGSRGFAVSNGTAIATFNTFDASSYSNVDLTFRLASPANGGNGIDNTDFVRVELSTDGGTTYSREIRIIGTNQ